MRDDQGPNGPEDDVIADLPGATGCPPGHRPFALAATILGSSMAFIDGTTVQVALPSIQSNLDAAFSQLQWTVNGYTLTLGALLLTAGALGDQVGRRRVFSAGVMLFAASSIACALAPNAAVLIVSRIIQGVGAALMVPQSLAIIAAAFPPTVRGTAIGTWAAFSALTTTAGPVLGGLLVDVISWRAVFWINVPLAAATLYLTWRYVPETRSGEREPVDWAGAVAATLTLAALTYVLTRLPDAASPLPEDLLTALMLLVAGAVGLVWIERRAAAPLVAPSLFRSREFSGLNAMTLLLYAALSGALFLLPYNLIQLQAYSAAEAGIAIAPLGVLIGLLSRYSGRISDRIGPRPLLVVGPVLVAAGCAGLALPGIGGSYLTTYFVPVMILALGMATAVSPLTTAVMNSVPGNRSGTASGINNAASRIAGLVAVAVSGALAAGVFDSALQARLTELNPGADVSRTMMAQTDKLAELSVPTNAGPEMRNALQQAVDGAFLAAFRAAVLLNAVLAGLAALIAALVLRSGRNVPGISQHP